MARVDSPWVGERIRIASSVNERSFARSWRSCSNSAGVLAQQLGLLLQRVLRRLETADDHGVHDPGDLEVGELAVERLVVDVAQEADHVVLGVQALRPHVFVDVVLEAVEASEHVRGLLRGELVLEPGAVDERRDDGIAPSGELRDVLEREPEQAGHDPLRQRPGEAADELDLAVADPLIEQVVGVLGDHVPVAQRPGPTHGSVSSLRWRM